MTTNQLTGRRLMVSTFAAVLMLFFAGTVITACKKDTVEPHVQLKGSHSLADEEDGSYSVADYQAALDDVEVVSGKLKFVNSEHFIVTGMVLDSLGDSLTQIWYQDKGFTNLLYNRFASAIDNMPDGSEDEIAGHFANYTNEVVYNAADETWTINAACASMARLVDADHKCLIGDNIFYTEYGVNVTVAATDEASIPTYAAMNDDYQDAYAIVTHNNISGQKTTAGTCVKPGERVYMGQINCGVPLKKRADVWFRNIVYYGPFGFTISQGTVEVINQKRSVLGRWVREIRGTYLSCNDANGKYFSKFQASTGTEFITIGQLPGKTEYCISNLLVCVSPMCDGGTRCKSW